MTRSNRASSPRRLASALLADGSSPRRLASALLADGSSPRRLASALLADGSALVGGAIFPLSLSPFDFWLAAPVSVLLFYFSVSEGNKRPPAGFSQQPNSLSRIILRFYLYNLALFGCGISWIYVSIHNFGGASPAMAAGLMVLMVAAYALIAVPQGFLYGRYCRSGLVLSLVGFTSLWVLQEWFRSWFLTGFPWLFTGYGVMDTFLVSYAPLLGIFGVSLVLVLSSCLVFEALRGRRLMLLLPVVVLLSGALVLDGLRFTSATRLIKVSLVQGNVDQHTKWQREMALPILERYMHLSRNEWGRELIVWPEAALTFFKQEATTLLKPIAAHASRQGTSLLLGIPDQHADGAHQNTVLALGAGSGKYIKRQLVPFGEYLPFENYLRGLMAFLDMPRSHNQPGPAEQAPLLAGALRLSTSICYEVAYPELVRRSVPGPDLLVTLSNDTWFGDSIGPWQHLQMARMRALENGRYMLRSTNNGITAVIDARGKIVASLPQDEQGLLRFEAELHTGTTPFHRFGHGPVLLLCVAGLLLTFMGYRLASRVGSDRGFR